VRAASCPGVQILTGMVLDVHDKSDNPITIRREWLHLAMGGFFSLNRGDPHGQHRGADRTDPPPTRDS
jgi:hypothetical protein